MNRLYNWYGKRNVILVMGVIVVLILILFLKSNEEKIVNLEDPLRTVAISAVSNFSNGSTFELIGSVEAIDKARIENEVSGRVTNVYVSLGDTVYAGQSIAQLENASERASVLQAEGVYEAALASAAQSDIGVDGAMNSLANAENNAKTTYRNSLTSLDNEIKNTVDKLFTDTSKSIIGFKLSATGRTQEIVSDRKYITGILEEWSESSFELEKSVDILVMIEKAKSDTLFVADFIEKLSIEVNDQDQNGTIIDGDSIQTFRSEFNGTRTSVNTVLLNLEASKISIESARDALRRAEIGGSANEVSAADAQVKQALGALRAAQANLAKTILRTPISGTVNLLSVKTGDFIGLFSKIATVANNDALEITTYVGETDRDRLTIGDTVTIEGKFDGIITNIAPAVDPLTKKVEVIIQSEANSLSSGDTVRISVSSKNTLLDKDDKISIPLTAVKFSSTDGFVFTVENNVITSHPVTLGEISGSNIIIDEGLTSDMVIIVDARGLNAGQEVEAITK